LRRLVEQQTRRPFDPLPHADWLAEKLQIDKAQASAMLGGRQPWDWAQLDKACSAFERPPGFFLDDQAAGLPADTKVVRSIDGSENMAFRPPKGWMDGNLSRSDWFYGTAPLDAHLYPPGALVMFAGGKLKGPPVEPSGRYAILRDEGGYRYAECVDVRDAVARFSDGDVPLMLPLSAAHGPMHERTIAGRIFGAVITQ